MTAPLFSIVITTYGRPRFLEEAIRSVMAQSIDDWECLVVDDASPQAVAVPDHPNIRLITRDRNGGVSAARNTGLDAARGKYITFLDDDDLYTPDRLDLALEGLARAPVSLCWRGNANDASPVRNRVLNGNVRDVILDEEVPHMGQTAVRASHAQPFDEDLEAGEATEWWLRASKDHETATVPRVGYLFRLHSSPRHRNDLEARAHFRSLLMEDHAEYFAAHPKAAAFQWKQIGLLSERTHDLRRARAAFWRSLRLQPGARTLWHLSRCMLTPAHVEAR